MTLPTVAILNSSPDLIKAWGEALELDGFSVVSAHVADIQSGILDLVSFIDAHDPGVILYDLPRPFERHWNFLRLMRETDSLKSRCWVVTTTDRQAVEAVAAPGDISEILLGEPYTLDHVVAAVRACVAKLEHAGR